MVLLKEVWLGCRPYLAKIMINFVVSASLWLALFIFDTLRHFLPVTGWPGWLIGHLHAVGIVLAFGIFVWLSVNDILQLHGGRMPCFA